MVSLNAQRKMLIMGTTRDPTLLNDMGLLDAFNVSLNCPMVSNEEEVVQVRAENEAPPLSHPPSHSAPTCWCFARWLFWVCEMRCFLVVVCVCAWLGLWQVLEAVAKTADRSQFSSIARSLAGPVGIKKLLLVLEMVRHPCSLFVTWLHCWGARIRLLQCCARACVCAFTLYPSVPMC
jgi:hypothetical protein